MCIFQKDHVPRDENIQDKKLEKIDKYQSLEIELEQLWKVEQQLLVH